MLTLRNRTLVRAGIGGGLGIAAAATVLVWLATVGVVPTIVREVVQVVLPIVR